MTLCHGHAAYFYVRASTPTSCLYSPYMHLCTPPHRIHIIWLPHAHAYVSIFRITNAGEEWHFENCCQCQHSCYVWFDFSPKNCHEFDTLSYFLRSWPFHYCSKYSKLLWNCRDICMYARGRRVINLISVCDGKLQHMCRYVSMLSHTYPCELMRDQLTLWKDMLKHITITIWGIFVCTTSVVLF